MGGRWEQLYQSRFRIWHLRKVKLPPCYLALVSMLVLPYWGNIYQFDKTKYGNWIYDTCIKWYDTQCWRRWKNFPHSSSTCWILPDLATFNEMCSDYDITPFMDFVNQFSFFPVNIHSSTQCRLKTQIPCRWSVRMFTSTSRAFNPTSLEVCQSCRWDLNLCPEDECCRQWWWWSWW